jgi:hypothetical protein
MRIVLLLLALASASAMAVDQSPVDMLSARSGLPKNNVSALLADCGANQTSINFCAWRDQIIAEQDLQHSVAKQEAAAPNCKAALDKKLAIWKKNRDLICRKSARNEWGSGSMQATAQAICATVETKRMTHEMQGVKAATR